jgi:hypothetical protein
MFLAFIAGFPGLAGNNSLFPARMGSMNDLFLYWSQGIYYAKKQLVKALPAMAQKATDSRSSSEAF